MSTPQSGIFALGTASHAYLELDAREPGTTRELVTAVASLREPRTTMGGINLVAGFRPELWREVVPDDAPAPRSRASTATWSEPTATRCRRRNTMRCSGSPAAPTTWSSIPRAKRSLH